MFANTDYHIHDIDIHMLERILEVFKCGVIRLWNWDNTTAVAGERPYLSVTVSPPTPEKIIFHYYAHPVKHTSMEGDEAQTAWVGEIDAWVNECITSVHQQVLGSQPDEKGWSVEMRSSNN